MRSRRAVAVAAGVVAVVVGVGAWLLLRDDDAVLCALGRLNDQRVIGHDGAISTELPDGRVLVLFGDTLIGEISEGRRQVDDLLGSSAAVFPPDAAICDPPLYVEDTSGAVRELLPLRPGDDPATIAHWPVEVIVERGQLLVLYRRVVRGESDNPLDVQVVGSGLATAPVESLQFELQDVAIGDDVLMPVAMAPRPLDDNLLLVMCAADPAVVSRDCFLGRIRLGAPSAVVELHAGGERWVTDITDGATPILSDGGAEMTFGALTDGEDGVWSLVYSPLLTCDVVLRTAPAPTGPWSDPVRLHEDEAGPDRFCYGGRLQRPFSTPAGAIVTWVRSGLDEDIGRDADLAWPLVTEVGPLPIDR
jgi:hypothetical protein